MKIDYTVNDALKNNQADDFGLFWMKFMFEDNGKGQNMFQGDSITLKMDFQANQTEGRER